MFDSKLNYTIIRAAEGGYAVVDNGPCHSRIEFAGSLDEVLAWVRRKYLGVDNQGACTTSSAGQR